MGPLCPGAGKVSHGRRGGDQKGGLFSPDTFDFPLRQVIVSRAFHACRLVLGWLRRSTRQQTVARLRVVAVLRHLTGNLDRKVKIHRKLHHPYIVGLVEVSLGKIATLHIEMLSLRLHPLCSVFGAIPCI